MVDIFKELDCVEDRRTGAQRTCIPKRTTLILILAVMFTIVIAAAALLLRRGLPPVGRELSGVAGVSIVRRPMLHGSRITNNRISDSGDCRIYRDGYELIYALCDALDQKLPLIINAPLPKGKYRISVQTDRGGSETLLKKLVLAYSEAFGIAISTEPVETEVYVMTCPDLLRLSLEQTGNLAETFDGNFIDNNDSGAPQDVLYKCRFTATPANLADYTGYMIRKTWQSQNQQIQPIVLAAAVVDETGLKGYYGGVLTWKFHDPQGLIGELAKKGLQFTREKRTIETIVIRAAVTEDSPDGAARGQSTK